MTTHDHRGGGYPFEQAITILAYAEMRAILLGAAGNDRWNPALRARAAVAAAISSGATANLVDRSLTTLRQETADLLGTARRYTSSEYIIRGQLGGIAGIEAVFHVAGKAAGPHRATDGRMAQIATSLSDFIGAGGRAAGPPKF